MELSGLIVLHVEQTVEDQKEQSHEEECTGSVTVDAMCSTSTQLVPTVSSVENETIHPDKKITPEEALSRVMEGEEIVWTSCPNCNSVLAAYIRTSKVSVALGPIVAVRPEQLSTDNR